MSAKTIKVVVPVSGGKDSQLCLEIALSEYSKDEVLGLFCDTKFEHPITYAHVERMKELYGVRIETVNAGTVEEKVLKYGRFPGGGARFCTEELKIVPSKKFYKELAERQGGFLVYYGMRLQESVERQERYEDKVCDEVYAPHEIMPRKYPKYLASLGVFFKLPILNFSKYQVLSRLEGRQNPLYAHHDRVGCFPCLAAGDEAKERAFGYDDFGRSQRIKVKLLEDATGKSIFTSKGGAQRNNPAQLQLCGICTI